MAVNSLLAKITVLKNPAIWTHLTFPTCENKSVQYTPSVGLLSCAPLHRISKVGIPLFCPGMCTIAWTSSTLFCLMIMGSYNCRGAWERPGRQISGLKFCGNCHSFQNHYTHEIIQKRPFVHNSCDPSRHLQESPDPPGPKSQKRLKKGLLGGPQKSPKKYLKKSKNTQKCPKIGISWLFRVFFETFLRTPKKTLFETFLRFRARRVGRLL